jgi:RNA polymerase sigma factor (sigma-70 family)
MAKRTSHVSSTPQGRAGGESLVDWREPERNARVLDWRERAHEFGLIPIEGQGPKGPSIVEPPERLLEEEEPEAFEEQPLEEADREALPPEEIEEAPEARLAREELDHVMESLNKLTRARAELVTELGREPRSPELAALVGMTVGKVELLLDAAKYPASLEAPIGEGEETPLGHLVPDVTSRSPEENAIRSELADEVERAMGPLNEREREVLRLRYGLGLDRELTLEEIGRRLSLTRERIRQIEAKAMAKIRASRDHAA